MPSCIMLGANSDIAKELSARLSADGWTVHPWTRGESLPQANWDLVICAVGILAPIGLTFDVSMEHWTKNILANAVLPVALLHELWPRHYPGASICFFSGAGVSRPAQTYSAYAGAKAMLMKMTELLDDEYEDAKFFILGPGMVRTKIQHQTLEAGPRAANFERVERFMHDADAAHGKGTPHDRIYACLKWCHAQGKDVVGGRNFYVPGIEWGDQVVPILKANRDMFKLRRFGGGL